MILYKRKGMALITVVLIAALFLISIVGISAKVISEKKVSNARSSSERALVTAETGLSQVLFNLRNTDFTDPGSTAPPGNLEYLTVDGARNIASNSSGYVLPLSEHSYSESTDKPYVTYKVKIIKTNDDIWDPDHPSVNPTEVSLAIYSLGTVYSDSSKAEVLARRVISTECATIFSIGTSSSLINYGILAGGDIEFRGNSQEKGGDIFANGKIISKGQGPDGLRVDGGTAYAVGQIPDGVASGGEVTGMDPAIIPSFDEYSETWADAFKTGATPYDGSTEDYPNTSPEDGIVAAVIQSCLGSNDTDNTLDEIQKFYSDLMGCTVDVDDNVVPPGDSCADFNILNVEQLLDLQNNANNIVYYINPAPGDGTGTVTIGAADLFNLKGIVVINGDLTITGGAIIGDYILDEYGDPISPEEPQFALIIRGTAKKQAGNAEFYGVLYADGGIEMGTGTFDCYGAMITPGNIKLLGDVTVYYKDTGFNETSVSGPVSSGVSKAELGSSSWKEISYEEFENPPSP